MEGGGGGGVVPRSLGGGGWGGGGERSRLPHLTDSSSDEGQTALLWR